MELSEGAGLRGEIQRLMQDFSLEVTPRELTRMAALPSVLAPGSRVYVTWVPGSSFDAVLHACVRLHEWGVRPVPHLSARAIANAGSFSEMLHKLKRDAHVSQALLIAGSQAVPAGSFDSSLALLAQSSLSASLSGVAFAAHPHANPLIDEQALASALEAKNDFAARYGGLRDGEGQAGGIAVHLVTQFGFDAPSLVAWEQRVRSAGNRLPIHLGLAGLASLPTLLKYAQSCGIGPSISVLLRQGAQLMKLARRVDPGDLVVAVARARLQDPACLIQRFHFFPFGAVQATVDWANRVATGQFELAGNGQLVV